MSDSHVFMLFYTTFIIKDRATRVDLTGRWVGSCSAAFTSSRAGPGNTRAHH